MVLSLNPPTSTAQAQEQMVTVVADGYSYLGDNDTIKTARERALAEAERNAVEQGSYSYLESQTTVKNYQVTTDEIKSRVKGVITSKKIMLDEMDKETLRYHVRLEAKVRFADLDTILKQQAITTSPPQEVPTEAHQPTPAQASTAPHRANTEKQISALSQLRRLKRESPHRYIHFMNRVEPNLNKPEVFMDRLQRLQARHPDAARKIRANLLKTPDKHRGQSELNQRLRFLQTKQPHEYILVMEMLFPEVRPPAMKRHWLQMRVGQR
jgi:hypothetical protein